MTRPPSPPRFRRIVGIALIPLLLIGLPLGGIYYADRRNTANRELILSVEVNDPIGTREALDAGADPNIPVDIDNESDASLPMSLGTRLHLIFDRIIGPHRNSPDLPSATLLYLQRGQLNAGLLQALLDAGANPRETLRGETLLTACIEAGKGQNRLDAIRLLLKYGVDAKVTQSSSGDTPLHRAMVAHRGEYDANGNSDVVQLLLTQGVDIDAQDGSRKTPLMTALSSYNEVAARILIDHHANLDLADKNGSTALDYAQNYHIEKIRVLLTQHGARAGKNVFPPPRYVY